MDSKEPQPDSLATVAVKEYPPSEVFTSEPPPAYTKPRSTAVQIARIAAVTLVLMSVILGAFILAAAWVQATASCQPGLQVQLHQDESDADDQPNYQQLVDPLQSEESNAGDKQSIVPPPQEQAPVQIKLPLTLDFDELAGTMMERNQRSRMNCVVEKRRAEEVVDHQPRTVRLPFGVNLTTDPRYEHVSGEKMAIFCESGKDQRHMPMEMMPAPIVVPLPGPVHLPLHFQGPMNQQQQQQPKVPVSREQHVQQIPLPLPIQAAIQVTEARQLPVQVAEARQLPIHVAEARHIQMAEARHIPIQVTEARHIPIQVTEARHIPIQVTEARHIPIQVSEARHIPVQVTEARHIPIQVTEARHIPIQEAREGPHMMPLHMAEAAEGRMFQHVPDGRHHSPPFPRLPVHVPVPMMQSVPLEQAQAQPRPHYVQPRSVRSVDSVLHKRDKRMRRCACDCSC